MLVEIVPDDVVRQLALHERLTVRAGPKDQVSLERCAIAPFEDCIFLFLNERSATVDKLKTRTWLEGTARDDEAGWLIRLTGRAVAGRPVITHARRMELLPWLPEGANARHILAVPFWPEEIEYVRIGRNGETEKYKGRTPAGIKLPGFWTRWARVAFRQIEWLVGLSFMADWGYLLYMGHETPLRWVALLLSTACSLLLLGGARMVYQASAFQAWREGRCLPDDAPMLTEGLVAPRPVFQLGVGMMAFGLALALPLVMWGTQLAWVAIFGTWLWLLGPVWIIHLSQEEPEKD
jgi:hypothetical protein